MNRKSRLALLAAALLSTQAMALPTRAVQEGVQTRTETVTFKRSQLNTAEGAARLYAQLQDAALRVCDAGTLVDDLDASLKACVADALAQAVHNVAIPSVSALHQAGRQSLAAR